MHHWINIKIFDESIIQKENDYYLKFNKTETPFLDEQRSKKHYKCLFYPPSDLSSPEDLESKYYPQRDSNNVLIEYCINKDEEMFSGFFSYTIFPCFVKDFLPNQKNFNIDQFAPDLSKEYRDDEKLLTR